MGEGRKVKEVKVRLPRSMYEKVLERVRARGYLTVAEYLREMLRRVLEEG